MKKLIFSAVMYCLTFSANAQPNVEDRVFLNNLIVLTSVSKDLENIDNWSYVDLDIKDIAGKKVRLFIYPYVNRFGELALSPRPTGSINIMGYNTDNSELNVLNYTIDYNERKRLIDHSYHSDPSTFIIPSETPSNEEVRIEEYDLQTGEPIDSGCKRIKYDEKKRIIAIIPRYGREYVHIKYNADNSIESFSTLESFNPKEYIKQKHQKVEYIWSGSNIKSVRFYQIIQSASDDSLVLKKTIDCEVVAKNDAGLWTAMDVVEKSNLMSPEYIKTEKYRLMREFK